MPDPGQCVGLRLHDGSLRQGFRAISCPLTAETGEVVVWVATEDEYMTARWANRGAVGLPWPADRMLVARELPWRLPQGSQ